MSKNINVAFVGNPNCGKTTLFNAFTGANLKVANWPGVTVEKIEGETYYKSNRIGLIDLPGIYSLTSYSIEEKISRKCIIEDNIDAIINVVDASCLERNLYLTLQLLEIGKPVIIALNMMDIVEERGMEIDLHRLPEVLGNVPVIPVSARKRTGLDVLMHAVVHHCAEGPAELLFDYGEEIESKISRIEEALLKERDDTPSPRWHAIKLLEQDVVALGEVSWGTKSLVDKSYEKEIISRKYKYIEEVIEETLFNKDKKARRTEQADRILTHSIWGIPIFFCIMALVFTLTFSLGGLVAEWFQAALEMFSNVVENTMVGWHVADWLVSLVIDGIIAGVGGILTFLPNIAVLFIALAILEDSGYMSRVAFIMDGIMGKVGMSGKAFLPLLLGFGCSVPAIMASRTLEHASDRKKVMLVTPFMSCSARLPIYVLFAKMFFGNWAMPAALSMYVLSMVMTIFLAFIMGKVKKFENPVPLMIELPEYKMPNNRTIFIYVWEKVKDYVTKAGTVIFAASIILWVLLNFNIHGMTDVTASFGASIGKFITPIFAPAGLNQWQTVVALISGISAKEVVVSSFSVLYGIANINSQAGMTELSGILGGYGFGVANAYALMVFCLLYTPCIATIATIKKEADSWKFALFAAVFQLTVAWILSVIVYQTAILIGF